MGFGLSAGGKAALGLGKTMLIGAASGLGSSLIGDLGDILIKGEDISLGEVFFNAAFSGAFGAAFSGIGYGFSWRKSYPLGKWAIHKKWKTEWQTWSIR